MANSYTPIPLGEHRVRVKRSRTIFRLVLCAALVLLNTMCACLADLPRPAVELPPVRPEIVLYNRFWYGLYFIGFAWGLLGYAVIIRGRLGPRICAGLRGPWSQQALVYVTLSAALLLWHLPHGLAGYFFERSHGFATHSIWVWLADRGKGWLIGQVTIPAVWLGYWLLRRSPKRWWVWLWAASVPWQVVMFVVTPVFIAPIYNEFRPLRDGALRDRIVALAEKAGVHGAVVHQVDISRRTTKLNAYMTGIGPTKRIVLWDTTLEALTHDEVAAIMSHEIGHYILGHVWWNLGGSIVGAFALLWLLSRLYPWAVQKWGKQRGVASVHDPAGLPIFLVLVTVLLFLQTPIESAISRTHERAADRYGLALNGDGEAMARAFVAFVRRDFADPDPPPFLVFWFYSHPPLKERVNSALARSSSM